MKNYLAALIAKAELENGEIASVLGLSVPSVCNKLAGRRPWQHAEIEKFLALLSARIGKRIKYENAFALPEPRRRATDAVSAGKR